MMALAGRDHEYSLRASAGSISAAGPHERLAPAGQAERHVGLAQRSLDVVADQDAGAPGRAPDQRLQQLPAAGVQRGARLVQQQQVGGVERGPGGGQALDHAARELAHRAVGAPLHAHGGQLLAHPLGGDAVQPRVVLQVLAPAELAVQQRVVAQVAQPPAHAPGVGGQR